MPRIANDIFNFPNGISRTIRRLLERIIASYELPDRRIDGDKDARVVKEEAKKNVKGKREGGREKDFRVSRAKNNKVS